MCVCVAWSLVFSGVCVAWSFVQLFHVGNKLIFNERRMRSTLYYTNTLSWICIVLAHRETIVHG